MEMPDDLCCGSKNIKVNDLYNINVLLANTAQHDITIKFSKLLRRSIIIEEINDYIDIESNSQSNIKHYNIYIDMRYIFLYLNTDIIYLKYNLSYNKPTTKDNYNRLNEEINIILVKKKEKNKVKYYASTCGIEIFIPFGKLKIKKYDFNKNDIVQIIIKLNISMN